MKHSSIILIGSGLLVGYLVGSTVHGYTTTETPPSKAVNPQRMEQPEDMMTSSSNDEPHYTGSSDLLTQTRVELDAALERIRALEKSAARYEWLKKNGMQTYGVQFDENTFTPQPQLLEFMGLSETASTQLRAMADDAKQALVDWEQANAKCIADTPTNCVYELSPLPEEYKERFVQELSTLFDPEDMESLTPIVDKLYDSLENKRTVSVTYISQDEYLQRTAPRFRSSNVATNGMLELMVQRYDENGNQRGSTSTIFSVDHVNAEYGLQARWIHLFKYGGETK